MDIPEENPNWSVCERCAWTTRDWPAHTYKPVAVVHVIKDVYAAGYMCRRRHEWQHAVSIP
jgi:hypothetical protein